MSIPDVGFKNIFQMIDLVQNTANAIGTTSLIDASHAARVEPLLVISKDCMALDYLQDVIHVMHGSFTGYYMQAVSLAAKINDVRMISVLDKVNPNRGYRTPSFESYAFENYNDVQVLTAESYRYKLPRVGQTLTLEAFYNDGRKQGNDGRPYAPGTSASNAGTSAYSGGSSGSTAMVVGGGATGPGVNNGNPAGKTSGSGGNAGSTNGQVAKSAKEKKDDEKGTSVGLGSDAYKTLMESGNLAIGKFISVEINIDGKIAKIPVSVRVMPTLMQTQSIVKLLALKSEDTSLTERYHAWRSGRISFINDLVFTQDLITEQKKALMNDSSGVYTEIVRRVNNSRKYGLLSRNLSLATASNLFIISDDVAKEVEQKLGGRLSNPRIRDKAFEGTYAMIIAVIDREWPRVTFYYRGISSSSDFSIKEIKSASKDKGLNVMDVFKSLSQGQAPF